MAISRLGPLFCVLAVVANCRSASPPAEDFSTFWNAFRTAALADMVDQVASMTRFPLEVRGPDDTDPVVTRTQDSFAGLLVHVMSQDSGVRAEAETVRQFLERTHDLAEPHLEPDGRAARVGDFVFERVGDRWMLVRVYLAEPQ